MKSNVNLAPGILCGMILLLFLHIPTAAVAQQKQLSVEELETYIAEQKKVLEEARINRDETQKKAEKVKEALAEQDARKALVEEELETLCQEQEELKSGTYEECMSHQNN